MLALFIHLVELSCGTAWEFFFFYFFQGVLFLLLQMYFITSDFSVQIVSF